ncbi:MAG: hypothetical protein JWM78_2312 [Verrucomicrobiaceae bacterium]|nr:hypothetical protein [Verrucomicrobiaceae bacterium]
MKPMTKFIKQANLAILLGISAMTVMAADEKPAPATDAAATAAPAAVADDKPASKAPAKLAIKPWWAYQPVQAQDVPTVKQKQWVRTPIDAFVLAKLEEKNLKPSPEADRAAFIRRATLDAWGIIPTPEEVKSFVADRSPQAYEKLVDRLLASPHYGERQARRWLDLARYADSTGFQNDTTRPNMYRYRDYVINSFNQDKPYDTFIKEQLAGDEIAPTDPNVIVATGFLAGYPDNYNSRDLVQRKYQITTDNTDTIGEVFLAQSVACARCHDHKFDKISEKEYFQLQAFLANTSEIMDIPAPVGAQEIEYRKQLAKYQEATKDIRAERKAILDPVREKGLKYYRERYLTDSRVSIVKPESEWNPHDRWINHRLDNVTTEEDIAAYLDVAGTQKESTEYDPKLTEKYERYKKLGEDLKKFDKLKPAKGSDKITAMTELGHPEAPATFKFFAGDHERPLEEVQPDFPAAIANGEKPVIVPTATSSGRRTALANWIASSKNPLTARVYVNRVWNEYFGKGIVSTVSDFGKAGEKPTHPELLDYLADNFVKEGWSVKKLHREILLSSVYRQSSGSRADAFKADPENRLLAVFPRKRLDAEQIRDSLLVAAGKLNDTVGGPSVFPPVPKNLGAGNLWEVSTDTQDFNRRSLYVFTRRSVAYPLLETFDMASPQQVHSKRSVTTTPLQALALANSDVVYEWSQNLAGRVINEAGNDQGAELDRLFQILFARNPDKAEKDTLLKFLAGHEKTIKDKAESGKFAIAVPIGVKEDKQLKDPIRASAFVDLVHTVANSNEFAYRN